MCYPFSFLHSVFMNIYAQELLCPSFFPVSHNFHSSNEKCTPFAMPHPTVWSSAKGSYRCLPYDITEFICHYIHTFKFCRVSTSVVCVALYPFIMHFCVLIPTLLQVIYCGYQIVIAFCSMEHTLCALSIACFDRCFIVTH
jgi:hypothetical protein